MTRDTWASFMATGRREEPLVLLLAGIIHIPNSYLSGVERAFRKRFWVWEISN